MDKRIQELAEQAGYKPLPGFDFANDLQEVFLKKFAELIARECIGQIALIGISNFENKDIGWTVDTAIANIKEHFGVEDV